MKTQVTDVSKELMDVRAKANQAISHADKSNPGQALKLLGESLGYLSEAIENGLSSESPLVGVTYNPKYRDYEDYQKHKSDYEDLTKKETHKQNLNKLQDLLQDLEGRDRNSPQFKEAIQKLSHDIGNSVNALSNANDVVTGIQGNELKPDQVRQLKEGAMASSKNIDASREAISQIPQAKQAISQAKQETPQAASVSLMGRVIGRLKTLLKNITAVFFKPQPETPALNAELPTARSRSNAMNRSTTDKSLDSPSLSPRSRSGFDPQEFSKKSQIEENSASIPSPHTPISAKTTNKGNDISR